MRLARALWSILPSPFDRRVDILYVGRLQPHKNVDLLIEAMALLRDRGRPLTAAIVGDGPERERLERLVAAHGLFDQIVFRGAVAEDDAVYAAMRAAHIFVHPSTKEGGGSVTSLEANAAGLPVVAIRHRNGLSPELIEEGVNGFWAKASTAETLAETIVPALAYADDPAAAVRCETFARAFDWSTLAGSYHDMFSARLRPAPSASKRLNAVAIWDNRAIQHYPVADYWPEQRRMERVTISGEPIC